MTVQNQIPKIVIGLVLITFSYAIAGAMIDMMWFTMYFVFNVMAGANLPHVDTATFNPVNLRNENPLTVFGAGGIFNISKDSSGAIGTIMYQIFAPKIQGLSLNTSGGAGGLFGSIAGFFVHGVLTAILNGFTAILSGIVSIIAFLIIAIAILVALLKLWFALIRCYVFILLDTILAPFWIAAALLPGSPLGFGKWIRSLAANLVVFPAVMFMFMLGGALMDSVGSVQNKGQFVPPLISTPGAPNAIASLIGMMIILLSPKVVDMAHEALKAPQNKYAPAVGAALNGGIGLTRAAAGPVWSRLAPKNQAGVIGGTVGTFLTNRMAAVAPGTTPTKGQRVAGRLANWTRVALGGR